MEIIILRFSEVAFSDKLKVINVHFIIFILSLASLLAVTIFYKPYNNSPAIRSDGTGYHIWVHGLKFNDFRFCNYKDLLVPTASISFINKDKGICGLKYPPGVGLLQFPFTAYFSSVDASEFSGGEHLAVLLIGAALLLLLAFFSYKTLELLDSNKSIAIISILAFIFGSGLFHYSTYDASFSHIYSAFGVSVLLWLVVRGKVVGWKPSDLFFFTLLVFWLYLVRQTNGLITLTILFIAMVGLSLNYKIILSASWLVATLCGLCVLIFYNFYVTGEYRISSYGQESFLSIGKYAGSTLFSYERGLFTYYPIYLLTAILSIIIYRSAISFSYIILIGFFSILYGSWHSWFLGGGMGHRGFIDFAPIGILVLGMSLNKIKKLKLALAITFIVICCYITISVMSSYWRGDFPFSGAKRNTYFSSILPKWFIARLEPDGLSSRLFTSSDYDDFSKEDMRKLSLQYIRENFVDGTKVVVVKISNAGVKEVQSTSSTQHPIRLSWRVADVTVAANYGWDSRVDLPFNIPAGGDLEIPVPVNPGVIRSPSKLQFSLVQEGVFWAHDVGVQPLTIPWQ